MNERVKTVYCLCAAWCGTCRDYASVVDSLAAAMPEYRFVWIDIEDESDVVGDVDVETFPTVLIADDATTSIQFFGPVLPAANHLRALLLADHRPKNDAVAHDLLARLNAHVGATAKDSHAGRRD
ncbi:MAG TPA: thioredoxin family protein [Burkholderiaceae bacterium]|nr:thioredoxin family protein [Burkholderiaceae bacterium]